MENEEIPTCRICDRELEFIPEEQEEEEADNAEAAGNQLEQTLLKALMELTQEEESNEIGG